MSRQGTRGWFLRRLRSPRVRWLRPIAPWRHGHAQEPVEAPPVVARGPMMPWVPAWPLVAWVSRFGGAKLAAIELGTGVDLTDRAGQNLERAYHRGAVVGTFTVYAADELAIRLLGRHPAEVWGDAWWDAA